MMFRIIVRMKYPEASAMRLMKARCTVRLTGMRYRVFTCPDMSA